MSTAHPFASNVKVLASLVGFYVVTDDFYMPLQCTINHDHCAIKILIPGEINASVYRNNKQ